MNIEELMRRCREESHDPTYADLLAVHAEIESMRAQLAARVPDGYFHHDNATGCEIAPPTPYWLSAAPSQQAPQEQRLTGFIVPTHFDPLTGAGIPDPTTFGNSAQQAPHCATCNDNGLIGGPSYYAPDEGGVPCPDCSQQAPVAQGEPVAHLYIGGIYGEELQEWEIEAEQAVIDRMNEDAYKQGKELVLDLFAHQQQASEPMTVEQIAELKMQCGLAYPDTPSDLSAAFVEGIKEAEQFHNIKGKQ